MKAFLAAWGAAAVVFLVIDAIWLGLVATSFYARALGDLMLERPKLGIAAVFYVGYSFAVVLLVSAPAARSGALGQALVHGAVFGLAAYGTYDITNMATLKNWPVAMSLVDMAWGTFLTAVAAAAGYAAWRHVS
jgi:uncharacterized membrane protein